MRRIFLFLCLILILCMSVSAEVDYDYWENHYVYYGAGYQIAAGSPPNGVEHIYSDSEIFTSPVLNQMVIELGGSSHYNEWPSMRKYTSAGTYIGNSNYAALTLEVNADYAVINPQTGQIYGKDYDQTVQNIADGDAVMIFVIPDVVHNVKQYGPTFIYHNSLAPLIADFDYTPSNPTLDDELSFISTSTPENKIDKYFWSINDASTGYLYAIAANVDSFKFKPENIGVYNVTLTITNTTNDLSSSISKNIEVISGVEVINRVYIKDASTQSLISGSQLQTFNQNSNTWINSTFLYTGTTIFPANQSDVVDIYAQAENFFPAEKLGYIIPKTGGTISLLLSPDSPASNESLNKIQIIVKEDDSSSAIPNVKLTVNQGDNSIVKYTNNDGYAVFELDPELLADILAEKSGYYELSKRLDISSPSSVDELRLSKILIAPTPTYTIPTPTLLPGQTGGGYNPVTGEYEPYYDPETGVYVTPTFTSGWENPEFVENICIKAPYPSNWGYMDILQNGIACNGVKGAVNQKLILSLIIITLIALVLSRYAKGTGALAGGIVGSLVCMGMGLLPIWIAILMVVICGIVIAKMIIGGPK